MMMIKAGDPVDQMIDAMKKAGLLLGGIFPQRYNPVVQAIQRAAAAGRFGTRRTNPSDRQARTRDIP